MTSNYTKDDDNSNMLSELHAEQDLKAANRPDAAVATTGQELWLDEMPKKRVKNKDELRQQRLLPMVQYMQKQEQVIKCYYHHSKVS